MNSISPKIKISVLFLAITFSGLLSSFFLISCGNNKAELEMQAKAAISKDIKSLTGKCLDGFTGGLGSMILNLTLSKKDQDSLLLKPVMPYVDIELKAKNEKELELLYRDGKERFKLISAILIKNKDSIADSLSEKYKAAKSLIDFVLKYLNENKEILNNLSS